MNDRRIKKHRSEIIDDEWDRYEWVDITTFGDDPNDPVYLRVAEKPVQKEIELDAYLAFFHRNI